MYDTPRLNRALLVACVFVTVLLCLPGFLSPYDTDKNGQSQQGLYIVNLLDGGNYFLPKEYGVIMPSKPPLYNWIAVPFCYALGVNEITIKTPTLLAAIGLAALVFLFAFRLFRSNAASAVAVLVLATNYGFIRVAHMARTDMLLAFWVVLALYLFYCYHDDTDGGRLPGRGRLVIFGWVALAMGTLTKGPVNLPIVLAPMLVFCILNRDCGTGFWDSIKRFFNSAHLRGLAIYLAMVLAWFVPAVLAGGSDFIYHVFMDEMVNRVVDPSVKGAQTQVFWYFIPYYASWFMPWTLFVPAAVLARKRIADVLSPSKGATKFVLIVLICILVFFSIPKGKRADYILVMYPVSAMLVGAFFAAIAVPRRGVGGLPASYTVAAWIFVALCVFIGAAALYIFTVDAPGFNLEKIIDNRIRIDWRDSFGQASMLGFRTHPFVFFTGLFLLASGMTALVSLLRRMPGTLALTVGIAFAWVYIVYLSWYTPFFERQLSLKPFCAEVRQVAADNGAEGFVEFVDVSSKEVFLYLKRNAPNVPVRVVMESASYTGASYAVMPHASAGMYAQSYPGYSFEVVLKSVASRNGDYQALVKVSPKRP